MSDTGGPLSTEGVNLLASFVIRPPRAHYTRRDLGQKTFRTAPPRPVNVLRNDFELVNARGQKLQCSHYMPYSTNSPPPLPPLSLPVLPTVVYLHGNGSCRAEASILFDCTLAHGMSVFALDLSGSGRSDGEYISLGVYEKFDVDTVVKYLSSRPHVTSIALWGHSMGAATAAMYAGFVDPESHTQTYDPVLGPLPSPSKKSRRLRALNRPRARHARAAGAPPLSPSASGSLSPSASGSLGAAAKESAETPAPGPMPTGLSRSPASGEEERGGTDKGKVDHKPAKVQALVLDSAYASFDKLAQAMVATMPLPAAIPRRLILSVGVRAVRRAVQSRAGFDVNEIDPLSAVMLVNPKMPAVFLQGTKDEIVHLSHAQMLFDAYAGQDKEVVVMEGIDHDSKRPTYAIDKAFLLLQRTLFGDEGRMSLRYVEAVKLRGNDCMVDGRYVDACFLYNDALRAIVAQERAYGPSEGGPGSVATTGDSVASTDVVGVSSVGVSAATVGGTGYASDGRVSDLESTVPSSRGGSFLRQPRVGKRLSSRFGGAFSGVSRKLSRSPTRPSDDAGICVDAPDLYTSDHTNSTSPPGSGLRSSKLSSVGRSASTLSTGKSRRSRRSLAQRSSAKPMPVSSPGVGRTGKPDSPNETSAPASVKSDGGGGASGSERLLKEETLRFIKRRGLSGERKEVALALLCNLSLANLKLKNEGEALAAGDLSIELDGTWTRGYQRKAAALKALGKLPEARLCVVSGLKRSPTSPALLSMEAEMEDEALVTALAASLEESTTKNTQLKATGALPPASPASVESGDEDDAEKRLPTVDNETVATK